MECKAGSTPPHYIGLGQREAQLNHELLFSPPADGMPGCCAHAFSADQASACNGIAAAYVPGCFDSLLCILSELDCLTFIWCMIQLPGIALRSAAERKTTQLSVEKEKLMANRACLVTASASAVCAMHKAYVCLFYVHATQAMTPCKCFLE